MTTVFEDLPLFGARTPVCVEDTPGIVIGSGVAGLSAALGLGRCTLLTETELGLGGSSRWAQGGVAVALADDDTAAQHATDTLAVSGGLGDPDVVRILTEEGPKAVAQLIALGARFDRDGEGSLVFGREAGHSTRRIVHADGDASGAELVRALVAAVRQIPAIDVVEQATAVDLLRADGRVVGVLALVGGRPVAYRSDAVILATGGYGHAFSRTTTPRGVIGSGVALAARAGADVADMEFVQFHPTALAVEDLDQLPLLTEALRGEGAILVDDRGERFMVGEHLDAELAPRDVVARAIYRRIQSGSTPYLDARQAVGEAFPQRFPTVFSLAQTHGLDPRNDLLPVTPAAHYCMGGIAVDADGRTSRSGLWAVGETTSSGVHGANRLASNSLLEGLVMGRRVATALAAGGGEAGPAAHPQVPVDLAGLRTADGVSPGAEAVTRELRELLWLCAGVERSGDRLNDARRWLAQLAPLANADLRTRNLHIVAGLVIEAATRRTESRGAHFRVDHPMTAPDWAHREIVSSTPVPSRPLSVESPVEMAA